jgi:putative (di)nucleoside polyphosphate hydrolase
MKHNIQFPLRPNVCMLLFNHQYKIFLAERVDQVGHWQFPQGGIEDGTTPEMSSLRELHEETGAPLSSFKLISQINGTNDYEFKVTPRYAVDKWRGQTQTFWLYKFVGDDTDIDISKHDPEFISWRWCTVEEVRRLANTTRLKSYESSIIEFQELIKNRVI